MGFWPWTSWAHLRVRTTRLGKVNPGYPEGTLPGIGGWTIRVSSSRGLEGMPKRGTEEGLGSCSGGGALPGTGEEADGTGKQPRPSGTGTAEIG